MAEAAGIFRKPFPEQVAAFRLRLSNLRTTSRWTDLWQREHDRAFMVAGAVKADLLADLAAAVDRAISEGTGIEAFRRDFREIVTRNGWHGWTGEGTPKGEAWRTKVIYRTNMATSYAAGRWAQLMQAGYPLLVYLHGASLIPREDHLSWDGLILPVDHPFWQTHAPPNGWGCSCYVLGARDERGAVRLGGKPGKALPDGWQTVNPKTGAPVGIDKGWAYAPGASATDLIGRLTQKVVQLPAAFSAEMVKAWPETVFKVWAEAFSEFVDLALSTHVQQRFMVVGALRPEWVTAMKEAGVTVETAEIAVIDKQVQHTFRGTPAVTAPRRNKGAKPKVDPLDLGWYRNLPIHLRSPKAVLLDQTGKEPVVLLIYDVPGKNAKLVVEINTPLKKPHGVMNTVESGRLLNTGDLAALIGRGAQKLFGEL